MNNVPLVIVSIITIVSLVILGVRIKDVILEHAFDRKRKLVLEYVDAILTKVPSWAWGDVSGWLKRENEEIIVSPKKDD